MESTWNIAWEEQLSSTVMLEVMTIDSKGWCSNDLRTRLMSHSRTASFMISDKEEMYKREASKKKSLRDLRVEKE